METRLHLFDGFDQRPTDSVTEDERQDDTACRKPDNNPD